MVSLTYFFFIYNQKQNIPRNIVYKVQKWSFIGDICMVMNGNPLDFRQSWRFQEKRGIWWNPLIRVSWAKKKSASVQAIPDDKLRKVKSEPSFQWSFCDQQSL